MPGVTVAADRSRSYRQSLLSHSAPSKLGGSIKWLPKPSDSDATINLPSECYGHPLVILSAGVASDGTVDYFLVTSFGSRSLEKAHPERESTRKQYLPIKPCKKHPDNGMLLKLAANCSNMDKPSYVNIGNRRQIPFYLLRDCNGKGPNYRLSEKSYADMISHCGYVPAGVSSAALYLAQTGRTPQSHGSGSRQTQSDRLTIAARHIPSTETTHSSTTIAQQDNSPVITAGAASLGRSTYSTEHTYHSNFRSTVSAPPAGANYGTVEPRYGTIRADRPVRWAQTSTSRRQEQDYWTASLSASSEGGDWRLRLLGVMFSLLCWSCLFYGIYRGGIAVVGLAKTAWEWVRHTWDGIKFHKLF